MTDLSLMAPVIRTTSTFHEVKSFAHEKLKGQYRTRYQSPNLRDFLEDPNQDLKKFGVSRKKGDETTTTTVDLVSDLVEECPIYIKRYNTKNAWHALRRTVQPSRAENCWMHAITLENLGIAIAPPVAFIQEYLGTGLKGRSWYLSESVDGENCLNHLPTINDETVQAQILEQIIDTLKKIWDRHITHGDLKGDNILLLQDQVVLLDLDAMKQHEDEEAARRHVDKDKERFLLNWEKDKHHPGLYELTRRKLSEAGCREQ